MPERRTRAATGVRVTLVTLLAVVLVGCGIGDTDPDGGGGGSGATEPGGSATMPTEIPSWLLECGSEDPKGEEEDELQLAELDLTGATWQTPAGFTVVTSYYEENPVETEHSAWYAEPTDPPMEVLNVANVIIYTGLDWGDLADGCGRVPLDAVEEKLASYREQIGAEPLTDAEMTEVAGHPAITQDIGLSEYSYVGYWLFSRTQLLHVYCQWTDSANRATLERGCDDILASLQVG